ESGDGFRPHFPRLAAEIDQIADVDDERLDVELLPQLAEPPAVCSRRRAGPPHARARRKDLEGVGSDLVGTLRSAPDASGSGEMDADARVRHEASVYGVLELVSGPDFCSKTDEFRCAASGSSPLAPHCNTKHCQ